MFFIHFKRFHNINIARVFTAIITLPIAVLVVLYTPDVIFFAMVSFFIILGLKEFYSMVQPISGKIDKIIIMVLGLFAPVIAFFLDSLNSFPLLLFIFFLLFFVNILKKIEIDDLYKKISFGFFGIFYVSFLFAHMILLRTLPDGRFWTLFLLIVVWATDIFAFLTGKILGKRKLIPILSPNKTVEGFLGGFIGGYFAGVVFYLIFLKSYSLLFILFVAPCLSILGQMGDLFESMLKRSVQIKDSGSFFPGHGGVLDRLDSLLFATPLLYYLLIFYY